MLRLTPRRKEIARADVRENRDPLEARSNCATDLDIGKLKINNLPCNDQDVALIHGVQAIGNRASDAFATLSTIKLPVKLQSLAHYANELNSRLDKMRALYSGEHRIAEEEIPRDQSSFFKELAKIEGYFKGMPESIRKALETGECSRVDRVPVTFTSAAGLANKTFGDQQALGMTSDWYPRIYISGQFPKPEETISCIAKNGMTPFPVQTLAHEGVHTRQLSLGNYLKAWTIAGCLTAGFGVGMAGMITAELFPVLGGALLSSACVMGGTLISFFLRGSFERLLLLETHAREATQMHPWAHIESDYPISDRDAISGGKDDIDTHSLLARRLFDTIRALRLLGVADEKIDETIRAGSREPKDKTGSTLEELLTMTRNAMDLEEDSVFEGVIAALQARHDVERCIARGSAKQLATAFLKSQAN